MADFAHSISATAVHPLSGSSKSGAPRPVFKPVPPPRPRPQIRPRNEGGADAEMIDLATRVEVLAERDHRAHARLAQVLDRIAEGVGFAPKQPEAALGEHLGLLALDRRVGRMFRRLVRWSKRLTATAPLTSAGLAAKAAASIAITDGGNYDEWTTDLANAVSRDAVRIATAKREPQDDAFLLSLIAQHASALAEWDAADDASNAPRDAYFSVVPPRPRALYWSANDPTRPRQSAGAGRAGIVALRLRRGRRRPASTQACNTGRRAPQSRRLEPRRHRRPPRDRARRRRRDPQAADHRRLRRVGGREGCAARQHGPDARQRPRRGHGRSPERPGGHHPPGGAPHPFGAAGQGALDRSSSEARHPRHPPAARPLLDAGGRGRGARPRHAVS